MIHEFGADSCDEALRTLVDRDPLPWSCAQAHPNL